MTQGKFLENVTDATNHRPLLWLALELTKDSKNPVAEFGAGYGSTPYLIEYCKDANREFYSFDSNYEWALKWQSEFAESWLEPRLYQKYSVALIDQAPGEYRKESIKILKDDADIIVIHDAEPDYSMGYELETIWHLFKYRIITKGDKIWTAALSNKIDLTQHANTSILNFKIEI
jgi:hypothetical protein